ncbi:hypothetical protein B0T10DRAFT_229685 [Thelonectria olida]|uniref:Fungal STAND N-terminal Goodbye domain-containing protein n=1 Tax=Thelonectria olida TaxID=1576542 RepID=A0A9P9ATJ6_9HYPO|nr:hypothetical protein B0T10DRAFT_229685 [Thelonectria olida]
MPPSEKVIFESGVDKEINQAWRKVEERVIQMAGGDRSNINPDLDIDNVLQYLDRAQTTDKKAAEKYGTIRNIFNDTLQCIQTVGGIVANGASYAFAPAGTCYNALTFVITAWQGYEGAFESLASLLEKCAQFLDRLKYYSESGMDAKLTKVACQHLRLFVDICDSSLKLKSKRHKFKTFMKQMFLNDDGVQELLSAMNSLVDKERGLVAAQTWKWSSDAAVYSRDGLNLTRNMHNNLVEDKNLQKHEREVQKWKHAIVDALELEEELLDDDAQVAWERAWKRHRSKTLEGSGEWLITDSLFTSWVQGEASSLRIFGLEGGDGTGKTLLASNVILHLRKMKTVGSSRVVVAHNFFESGIKSAAPTDTAVAMSRSLMCQLAFGHEPFMKSVASICEKSVSFDSPLEIWRKLLLQNEDLDNLDVTFFLVLDGLGVDVETFAHILNKLSDSTRFQKTRIFLTGSQELFSAIERVGRVKVDKIVLGEANKQDIKLYVKHRMEGMDMFKDVSRPDVSETRENILKNVLESTAGDFYKINRVLDNISKTDEVEEINAILETAGDARPDQIEADIESLNKTRTAKEISEINEIILWVSTAGHGFTPHLMESAMALKPGNGGTLLMSMESKIKTKYTIFSAEYGTIQFKVDGILEMIPRKKRDSADENSSSGFKEIQPAEINIIRHYLGAVCPPDLYKKFGFDEFFNLKMVRKSNYIYQDPDNNHITMVIRCLTCLVEKRNEKTERLLNYSCRFLAWHMKETDLSLAERSFKSKAGELLVRLFTEQHGLKSLLRFHVNNMSTENHFYPLPPVWGEWVSHREGPNERVNLVAKWFGDSAVIETVKSHPLVTAIKAEGADKALVLYEAAAKLCAEDLFINATMKGVKYTAFHFLRFLLPKNAVSTIATTLELFHVIEDWSQELLGVTKKTANWEAQAVALLCSLPVALIPESAMVERAQKALELDPTNWTALYTLFQLRKSDESAAAVEKLVDRFLKDDDWQEANESHRILLARMMFDLGDKYWEIEDGQDKAIKMYSKVLEIGPTYPILKGYFSVFEKYRKKKLFLEIISFLEKLLQIEEDGSSLGAVFVAKGLQQPVHNPNFLPVLVESISSTDRYDLLETLMKESKGVKLTAWQRAIVEIKYAEVLIHLDGHEGQAIDLLEMTLAKIPDSFRRLIIGDASEQLVEACKKAVMAEGVTPEQAQEYDKKALSCWEMFERERLPWEASTAKFALYFRARGDKSLVMRILQRATKEALEMLCDDDLANDFNSFWNLGQIFAVTRDIENTLVAWHMMEQARSARMVDYKRKLEEWTQRQEASKANDKGDAGSEKKPLEPDMRVAVCDGGCLKHITTADALWVCLTEGGLVQFCDDCYPTLQERDVSTCKKDHEHLHLAKDNEKIAAIPEGSVMVGERTVTLDEWKKEIKAKYVDSV